MDENNYIKLKCEVGKLIGKVSELETKVKAQDELIELLTDTLIELQGTVAGLEEKIYSKQKRRGFHMESCFYFRENNNSYNEILIKIFYLRRSSYV